MASSTPLQSDQTIRDTAQLSELLAAGCKPEAEWRIGTEHEKFVFCRDTRKPLPYEGSPGIGELLEAFAEHYGWSPVYEAGKIIALKRDGGSITLEPGGQLELSGAPLETIHQTCAEVHTHLRQAKSLARDMQVGFLGLGFCPDWRRDEIPWMPKRRYQIMGDYMKKVGTLGHDMMLRTCTVQVNLDFASEADMVRKFRVALALQPVATALFANSPFTEGRPNGFMSRRSAVWEDTDNDRCGMLDFVFDDDMGFERYVEYMLDVPMYFVMRDGEMIDCAGQSFRDFMAGRLPALPGERPLISDFEDHLTTAFPEARLKTFLEMRGADAGPWSNLCALPAFWVGLLYDEQALAAAWQLCADWRSEQRAALRHQTPRDGLATPTPDGRDMHALASDVLRISEAGLRRRARVDGRGRDESMFLQPLWQTIERRETPAEELLRRYHREWGERTDPLYDFYAY